MESGIKHRNLHDLTGQAFDDLNSLQFSAVMQRRKGSDAGDHALYLRRHHNGLIELVASMNDAMTHCIDCTGVLDDRIWTGPQSLEHMLDRVLTIRFRNALLARWIAETLYR